MFTLTRVISKGREEAEKVMGVYKTLEDAQTAMNSFVWRDFYLHSKYDTHETYAMAFRAYDRGLYKYGAYDLYIKEVQ